MSVWLRLGVLILGCLLNSCTAGNSSHSVEVPASRGLPPPAQLDALRSTSAEQQLSIDPQTPLLSANSSNAGNGLDLTAPEGQNAWALYRVNFNVLGLEAGELRNVQLSGSGTLWLLLADFTDSRWLAAAALSDGVALGDFTAVADPLSGDGFAYFAVLAPAGSFGHIDALQVNYRAPASTFYVAVPQQGGDDSNDGSSEFPWATLQHASDSVGPDSLVVVRPGLYQGFSLEHGGVPDAPIVFRAQPGVVINSNAPSELAGIWIAGGPDNSGYIRVEGFELLGLPQAGIVADGKAAFPLTAITLRNNRCAGMEQEGIYTVHVSDSLIESNHCTSSVGASGIRSGRCGDRIILRGNRCELNWGPGILIDNNETSDGDRVSSELLLENNFCFDNHGGGMRLLGAELCVLRNNLLYRNAYGIGLFEDQSLPSVSNRIVNNTVFQDSDGGSCIALLFDCTGNLLFNNILLHDTADAAAIYVHPFSLPGFLSDYNIVSDHLGLYPSDEQLTLEQWRLETGQDQHSQVGVSINLFVSTLEDDYHLKSGALAIDAGLADFAPLRDLEGVLRSQGLAPDCGCYEKAGP